MERSIDKHEIRRPHTRAKTLVLTKINKWRNAWTSCYEIVSEWQRCDLKQFHFIFERWVPILNWIFENPIPLNNYETHFYYHSEPNGPKEVVHIYMDPYEKNCRAHVIFNLYEFNIIRKKYYQHVSKSNNMLVDEARGIVNLSFHKEQEKNPAEYFQTMTTWQLLFVYTLHALAHWQVFQETGHQHYDSHLNVRESPFFKLYFYGQIMYGK